MSFKEEEKSLIDEFEGDDLADKHKINIANILVQTEDGEYTTDKADEALSKEIVAAYKLYRNSQIGEKERDEIITEASRVKELISRFDINDDNVDFYALIDNRSNGMKVNLSFTRARYTMNHFYGKFFLLDRALKILSN